MHAIRTQTPLAPIEEALKTPAFSPVLTALEWCVMRDAAFIRAIGGPEFEELIWDLRQTHLERARRERARRKHWPMVQREDEP
jgi:hypothetical protein